MFVIPWDFWEVRNTVRNTNKTGRNILGFVIPFNDK